MMGSTPINPAASPSQNDPVDYRKLRQALIEFFNEVELRDLCFDLDVNYEDLPTQTQSRKEKARELVEHFRRRQRLKVLQSVIEESRPEIVWVEIAVVELDTDTASAPSPPVKAKTADKTNTLILSQGVTALIRLMRSPQVRDAVVAFQTDFEAASEQIDLMNDYKLLHDLFQELENRYFLIYNDQRRLPADDTAWDSVMLNEPELQGKIADILKTVRLSSFANDKSRWIQQLEKAKDQIRDGVEQFELDNLRAGTRLLYRILNRQPSRINAQLVTTAASLRLDTLESAMQKISENLSQADFGQEAVSEIQKGVAALAGLDSRVSDLVREHNTWQELDDELRRVEGSLGQGIDDLEDAWFDLEPMTAELTNGHTAEWAVNLNKVCRDLDAALDEGAVVKVKRLFRRLRSQEGRRFREIDYELLTLCQELQKVGESLDLLLRNFR